MHSKGLLASSNTNAGIKWHEVLKQHLEMNANYYVYTYTMDLTAALTNRERTTDAVTSVETRMGSGNERSAVTIRSVILWEYPDCGSRYVYQIWQMGRECCHTSVGVSIQFKMADGAHTENG